MVVDGRRRRRCDGAYRGRGRRDRRSHTGLHASRRQLRRYRLELRHRHRDRVARDDVRRIAHPGRAEQADEGEHGYDEASTHDSSATVAAAGKRTSARVPPSIRLASEALPRQRWASVWTIASPRPVPGRELPALPRAKRSNRLVSSPGESPGPFVEDREPALLAVA